MSTPNLPGASVACLLLAAAACNSKDPVLLGGSGGAGGTGAAGGIAAATGGTTGGASGSGAGTTGGASGGGAGQMGGGPGVAGGGAAAAGGGAAGAGGGAGSAGAITALASADAYDFYCGIKGGQMACWGSANDSYWAMVNAPAFGRLPPNLVQFAMSNVPYDQTPFCGVDATGAGTCWGPQTNSRSIGTGLKAVSASDYGVCQLSLDGGLTCDSPIAAPASGPTFVAISASEDKVGTLDDTGAPWFPYVSFPPGRYIELVANDQSGVAAVRSDGAVVSFHQTAVPTVVPGSFVHAAIDYYGRVCGLDRSGWIGCWTNDTVGDSTPVVAPTGSFTQLVGGESTFCAARTDGTIACWGDTAITLPAGW